MSGAGDPAGPAGVQRERTALAWDRTGLSLVLVGALLVRASGPPYPRLIHLGGLTVSVLGAATGIYGRHRYEQLQASAGPVPLAGTAIATVTAIVVAGGVLSLVLLALGLLR